MTTPEVRRVTREQFRLALHRAAAGIGAGLACRYDARHDGTIWTINGQAVGLTVGRSGATRAYYLAGQTQTAAAMPGQLVADDCGSNA